MKIAYCNLSSNVVHIVDYDVAKLAELRAQYDIVITGYDVFELMTKAFRLLDPVDMPF